MQAMDPFFSWMCKLLAANKKPMANGQKWIRWPLASASSALRLDGAAFAFWARLLPPFSDILGIWCNGGL
jgi:hypothetical protein